MDRHEPQVPTNSTNADTEISAARRILNGTGNFLKNGKNRLSKAAVVGIVGLTLMPKDLKKQLLQHLLVHLLRKHQRVSRLQVKPLSKPRRHQD